MNKALTLFIAVLMIVAIAFAGRTRRVNSCYDDVHSESACMQSWENEAGDNDPNTFINGCQWCLAKAVPSVCASHAQTQQLPPGVFICSNVTAIPKF